MKKILFALALPLIGLAFSILPERRGSTHYPQHYFRSPVSHAMLLSGTFGELRPNHFHAGVDIKPSRGVPGDPIFAAASGHIAKIRVEESGYGRSLYLSHPNGYTTVYAHLEKFSPEIEDYLKEQQYQRRAFALELMPDAKEFPVVQGQQIGNMGNTGASNGAHLHFEVRETRSQKPINPLLFGFDVTDNIAPKMHSLKAYFLNDKREEREEKTFPVTQSGGNYRIKGDTLTLASPKVGFALKVFDHFDRVSNWNGIYALSVFRDDSLVYDFDLESFGFEETRYINAHCDYTERVTKNSYYNRCYTLPGNQLSIYNEQVNFGVMDLPSGRASKITMVATDVAGNAARLDFWVKRGPFSATPIARKPYNYVFTHNEGNLIQTPGIYLHLPAGTLYEDLYLRYEVTTDRSSGHYSDVHQLYDGITPIHHYFDIGIRPTLSIPAELKPKVFVALCDSDGDVTNCGGNWQDGFLRTKVRSLGNYCILVDKVPPTVRPISFQQNMKGFSKLSFRISDNVAVAPNVRGMTYDAWIDGEWVLLEFDKKSSLISHRFDGRFASGEHNLHLVVKDAVGNETVVERKFVL